MKTFTSWLILSFFLSSSLHAQWSCGDTLLDIRDGKMYPTVQIGNQCWMAKNLNIGVMLDCGNPNANQTNNSTFEKFCYNSDTSNCILYGGLYQWDEMMQYSTTPGVQGICPAGWHVPTETEYTTIESNFPSGTAASALKVGGSSGFEATTGGYCYHNYSNWVFGSMGSYGVLRTSTESTTSTTYACVRYYYPSDPAMYNTCSYKKNNGYTVRCIYNGPACQ
ncbi:FISUMP domain-containing protein, partial [candidate division KSB1 bacterium]